ncbi:hypothetical protein ACSBR1_006321 [Camellia fascicularis]
MFKPESKKKKNNKSFKWAGLAKLNQQLESRNEPSCKHQSRPSRRPSDLGSRRTTTNWSNGSSASRFLLKKDQKSKQIVREGVEFYSNGDFYEGEFHKGRCNESEVYNCFVNGRYEGDWVDGRYDGYGIESWTRGSRFRGQYRQGLRNGYGVYRFYTGDAYAGE